MDLPLQAYLGQLTIGLINGSFYALLGLGLAVIFGMLHVINFAHGAQYMLGAFVCWMLATYLHIGYLGALVLVPLTVGLIAAVIERTMLSRLYSAEPVYGLLLTFGVALLIQGGFQSQFGSAGTSYQEGTPFKGAIDLGFLMLPSYRVWVVAASLTMCAIVWITIEKTKIGSYLRAATEDARLVQMFGVNVPLLKTATYSLGAALAAFGGVLAAPMLQITPDMGQSMIIVLFAVVVIGGMGSIVGTVVTGYLVALVEAVAKLVYPEAAAVAIYAVMALVLIVRPRGLFGRV